MGGRFRDVDLRGEGAARVGQRPSSEELDGEKWTAEDEYRYQESLGWLKDHETTDSEDDRQATRPGGTQERRRRPAAGRANHVFLSRWSIMTRLVLDWLAFTLVRTR